MMTGSMLTTAVVVAFLAGAGAAEAQLCGWPVQKCGDSLRGAGGGGGGGTPGGAGRGVSPSTSTPSGVIVPNLPGVPATTPLGVIQQQLQQQQQQQQQQQTPSSDRREATALNDKGVAAYARGDWDAAIDYFEQALRYNREDPTIRANLERARARKQEAIQRERENDEQQKSKIAQRWFDQGVEAWKRGNLEEAARLFREALQFRPGDRTVVTALGTVEAKLREAQAAADRGGRAALDGKWDDAVKHYKAAVEQDPNNRDFQQMLKTAEMRQAKQEVGGQLIRAGSDGNRTAPFGKPGNPPSTQLPTFQKDAGNEIKAEPSAIKQLQSADQHSKKGAVTGGAEEASSEAQKAFPIGPAGRPPGQ